MFFIRRAAKFIWRALKVLALIVFSVLVLTRSLIPPGDELEQIRHYTRPIEFDFLSWTLNALGEKAVRGAMTLDKFIQPDLAIRVVNDYLKQVENLGSQKAILEIIYSDPSIEDPYLESQELRESLLLEQAKLDELAPLAETILQGQLAEILSEHDLSFAGQALPPVLYRVSELPLVMIVSPRDEIRQVADISLLSGLSADEKDWFETLIFENYDYSVLIVPIGGMSAYPTMVMQTTDLAWLTEVIAHEWTHNYLALRPLGINYDTTPELRTINETTASLVGKEMSFAILACYYPEKLPVSLRDDLAEEKPQSETLERIFDFRAEMRQTRIVVDRMLSNGKVEEAEQYMELRRQVFWENGYLIRKLNQAYFAFYGAYNDQPGGGASGDNPVGPAVVALRQQSSSLSDFLGKIAHVTSYEELLLLLEQ